MFPAALILTAAMALIPGAQHVAGIPRELLRIVLSPFTHLGNTVGQWLRPPPPSPHSGQAISAEYVRHLEQETAEYERLYLAEQLRVQELERQLRQLQKLDELKGPLGEYARTPVRPLIAHVTLRSPTSPIGLVTLNRGRRHDVTVGTIAVYDGVELVGRVTEASALHCTLTPLSNPATGLIVGAIVPKDRQALSLAEARKIDLTAVGDGTLIANVDKLIVVHPDDEIRLVDSAWPDAAQAMVIGRVESVRPNDREPLRNSVIVRPAYALSQIASVTLKIETVPGSSEGAP